MAKFSGRTATAPRGRTPITTSKTPDTVTHEGAPAYSRDPKGELFLLAVSNMVGEDTFYESAGDRDARYASLVGKLAVEDPAWTAQLLKWLRSEGNMRSAPVVGAAEYVRARLAAKAENPDEAWSNRRVVDSVLQRPDEPGEILGYWLSQYGRAVPKPIKRGVGDAAVRLYNERSVLKYDTASHGVRFGDVLELTHPVSDRTWQGDLFKHCIDRRHGRDTEIPESLTMLRANRELQELPVDQRREVLGDPERLRAAGMTWESLAGWLQGPMDKQAWEAIIPQLGLMAAIRNLRNFDQAGVSDEVADGICERLKNADEIARSRQFPFRFYSAYANAPSLRWGPALEKALSHSTKNIPALGGRTLILVDTSGSMTGIGISAKSSVSPLTAAALFGVSLAAKGEQVDLVGFADGIFAHNLKKGASVLKEVERFVKRSGEVGHGTRIAHSLRAAYKGHDRVVLISDQQTFRDYEGSVTDAVPQNIPIYGFNLGGYRGAAMPSTPTRHEFGGGLTDSAFRMLPLLEAGKAGKWPWEDQKAADQAAS